MTYAHRYKKSGRVDKEEEIQGKAN